MTVTAILSDPCRGSHTGFTIEITGYNGATAVRSQVQRRLAAVQLHILVCSPPDSDSQGFPVTCGHRSRRDVHPSFDTIQSALAKSVGIVSNQVRPWGRDRYPHVTGKPWSSLSGGEPWLHSNLTTTTTTKCNVLASDIEKRRMHTNPGFDDVHIAIKITPRSRAIPWYRTTYILLYCTTVQTIIFQYENIDFPAPCRATYAGTVAWVLIVGELA